MHICISDDRRSGTVSPVQRPVKTGFFISLRFLNSNRVLSALQFRDMGRPGFPPRPVFNSSTASVQSSSFLLVKFPSMCPADDLVIQVHHQYDRNQNFQTESVNFITSTSKFLCLLVRNFQTRKPRNKRSRQGRGHSRGNKNKRTKDEAERPAKRKRQGRDRRAGICTNRNAGIRRICRKGRKSHKNRDS